MIGLSGGVNSALTAAVAADALGPERVHTLMMPSPYTSAHSLEDAKACAEAIGVRYDIVGIEPAMEAFREMLLPLFGNRKEDVTEENIQSRARGVTLMAVSNKLGGMVVTTGNKSEMAVGYATLYGDMCGGYNVLKDVYKTTVFELCRWRNAHLPDGRAGPEGQGDPRAHHHQAAVGRAAARPEGRGFAAALSGARRHPEGPDRARPRRRGAGGRGPRPRHRQPRLAPARGRRVQAPPGAARREDHLAPDQQGAALSRSSTAFAGRRPC